MKRVRLSLLSLWSALLLLTACTSCSDSDDNPAPDPDPTPDTTTSIVPALNEVIMYEANPRLFGETNGLKGLDAHLQAIKDLGVNVLWVMPICEYGKDSKSIGSPYCTKDYTKVEPKLGTLEDFQNLVHHAHDMGMAVILDWVANHTSWDNAWISHKDWYTQDGAGNIISPAGTGWNDVADLNFDNPAMCNAMIDALKYWIQQADIDGYRCDAADYVPAAFWTTAITQLRAAFPQKELLMLAEGADRANFTAGFDMNYAWDYYDTLESVFKGQSADKIYKTHTQEYTVIPDGKEKLRFTTNHDKTAYNGTPVQIYGGKEGALSALAITTWMGGAPMIYSSQECAQAAALDFMAYTTYNWDADKAYTQAVAQILDIRRQYEIFSKGRMQDYSTTNVVMFYLLDYPTEALVVANVRNSSQSVTLPSMVVGKSFKNAVTGVTQTLTEELSLGAYEYALWIK